MRSIIRHLLLFVVVVVSATVLRVQATTGPVIQMVLAQVQEPGNGEFGILQISGSNLGCEAWPFASACSLPGNRKPMVVRINCLSVKQRQALVRASEGS